MATFLENTGDIILDAVLTDYGRQLLAKGDGSFKIVKFAFGDDEIDYSQYVTTEGADDLTRDLKIAKTPILEAFTNNAASMTSKLLTIGDQTLLFLPVLKLNSGSATEGPAGPVNSNTNSYIVLSTDTTTSAETKYTAKLTGGSSAKYLRIEQGIDSDKTSPMYNLDTFLQESEYLITMDSRFGRLIQTDGEDPGVLPTIDDDMLATYRVSMNNSSNFVMLLNKDTTSGQTEKTDGISPVIVGNRGTMLKFAIQATQQFSNSPAMAKNYGQEITIDTVPSYAVNSFVRVEGTNTGYRLDIPISYVMKK